MKRLFAFFFISIFFFSCQKDKQVSIVGLWTETSYCIRDNSGAFDCSGDPKFPLRLTLSEDGKYYAFNDVPAGQGIYHYNYWSKQLTFEDSGGSVTIATVSVLNDDYLVTDYSRNGVVEFSQKYLRK
jgi:hypothetical protein